MSKKRLSVSTFIPETLGSKDILFENAPVVGTVEFTDGIIIFPPAFLFIFIGDLILPTFLEAYTLLISIIITVLGLSLLLIKPSYMSLGSWFKQIRDFRQRERNRSKNISDEQGELFDSYDAVPDDDTRKLTKISRVFPERDALELENGTMIAIMEFSGSNLDMAPENMKMGTIDKYARSLSSQLQDDIQFYLPMRPISLKSSKSVYKDRIQNQSFDMSDRRDNFMDAYLDDRMNWIEFMSESSYVREQYVVVKATSADVRKQSVGRQGSSGIEQLPGGEIVSDIKAGLSGEARLESEQELRRKKLRELSSKVETVGGTLSVGPGNSYRRVGTEKCVGLLKEFWEGERITDEEMKSMSVTYPFPILDKESDKQ